MFVKTNATVQLGYLKYSYNSSVVVVLHRVSKNVPPFTCCNLYIHGSIATVFGKNVAEKVDNQNVLYFPPHLTNASAVTGETGNSEIASFDLNDFLPKNTKQ